MQLVVKYAPRAEEFVVSTSNFSNCGGIMKILGYVGVLVLAATFSFPLSAGAFGRSPSNDEVMQSPKAMSGPVKKTTTGEIVTGTPQAVPEPSSFLLIGIALGLVAVVSMRKRSNQAVEK